MARITREKDYHLTVSVSEYSMIMTSLGKAENEARDLARKQENEQRREYYRVQADRLMYLRVSIA